MLLLLARIAVLAAIEIGVGRALIDGFMRGRLYVGRIEGSLRYVYRAEDPAAFNRQAALYILFMVAAVAIILV